jgi:hypothetical protein
MAVLFLAPFSARGSLLGLGPGSLVFERELRVRSVAFTYTGTMDGHDVDGRVADGKITGNPFVAIRVQSVVDNGVHVGLGPWAGPATLDDDIRATATIAAIVEKPKFNPPVKPGSLPEDAVS